MTAPPILRRQACGHVFHDDEQCPYCTETGGSIWLSHEHYDSPFGAKTGAIPERLFHVTAPIGYQSGTYFKTSKQHDGMTVWLWGGVHPDDLKDGHHAC